MTLRPDRSALLGGFFLGVTGVTIGWLTREQHAGEAATRIWGIAKALTIGGVGAVTGAFFGSLIATAMRPKQTPEEKEQPSKP